MNDHIILYNYFSRLFYPFNRLMLVDCVWNNWNAWTSCSKSCGGGQLSRTRITKVAAQGGGKECGGPEIETKVCNTQDCIGGKE